MERIYLDCLEAATANGIVKVAVFYKDLSDEHISDLKGFLKNQSIKLTEFTAALRQKKLHELGYFDNGFIIEFSAKRWSFFEIRSYIRTFLTAWDEDVSFCGDYFKDAKSRNEELIFNDSGYVELSRFIDQFEDRYYSENNSIAHFIDGILRILHVNLELYWAAAKLADLRTGIPTYLNHVPASDMLKKKIISSCSDSSSGQCRKFPMVFMNEHIADFFVCPGPFSPPKEEIDKFVEFVLMHVDDFIFGDITFRKRIFQLESTIAETQKENIKLREKLKETEPELAPLELEDDIKETDLNEIRIILVGDPVIKKDRMFSEFKRAGFNINKITLRIEYDKIKQLDINDLKLGRSRYDAILLGPMPHKVRGDQPGESLIGMMENHSTEYPPFVVCRERSGKLKITNNSLKSAIKELVPKIDAFNNYIS